MALPPAGACQYTPDRHERTVAASGYRSPGGSRGGVGYSEPTRTAHTSRLGPPAALRPIVISEGTITQCGSVVARGEPTFERASGVASRAGPRAPDDVVATLAHHDQMEFSSRHRQRPPLPSNLLHDLRMFPS